MLIFADMNTALITSNILLFFAQGAYFLLIAIFTFKFLRQYRVRIKLFTGILLSVWLLLSIKDLIIYHSQACSNTERINWINILDQLAIPIIGITMFEMFRARSITLFKGILHLLPFVVLLLIFCITNRTEIVIATIGTAAVYSIFIIIKTLFRLRTIPRDSIKYKTIFNISCSFLVAISVWALSCFFPSILSDIIYYIVSGIVWYIIYINIEKAYPSEHKTDIQPDDISEPSTDTSTHTTPEPGKTYSFAPSLQKLFEIDQIFLNPEITLSDVARRIGTNRSYLSDYFNHECNSSFNNYINNLRLSHAEKLITTNPTMPIDEIASNSGFNSTTTFRRAFAKKHGITPSQYRQNIKKF